VRENPIRDLSFGRRSAGLRASAVTAAAWGTSIGSSVAQLDETARDLSDRLTIYAEQLPRSPGGRGDPAPSIRARDPDEAVNDIEDIDRRLGTIDENFGTVTGFVTGTPALIAAERTVMLEALAHERDAPH
jgi:hypothetical protein